MYIDVVGELEVSQGQIALSHRRAKTPEGYFDAKDPHSSIWILWVQDGAPKIAKLPYKWLNMVDITIVTGSYFMVYKPTFTYLGGPIL